MIDKAYTVPVYKESYLKDEVIHVKGMYISNKELFILATTSSSGETLSAPTYITDTYVVGFKDDINSETPIHLIIVKNDAELKAEKQKFKNCVAGLDILPLSEKRSDIKPSPPPKITISIEASVGLVSQSIFATTPDATKEAPTATANASCSCTIL